MKHLSRMDIEAIAEKYIRKYMELPEVQERTVYRIEPELFLTNVLGLNIGYFHLSYDSSLLGLTAFEEVLVNVLTAGDEEESVLLDGNTVLVESDLQYDEKLRGRILPLCTKEAIRFSKDCSRQNMVLLEIRLRRFVITVPEMKRALELRIGRNGKPILLPLLFCFHKN